MKMRTRRGGPWIFRIAQRRNRSAYRSLLQPNGTDEYTGFRVVCLPQEVAPRRAVLRGGCWDCLPRNPRSAFRGIDLPFYVDDYIGFRVVRLSGEVSTESRYRSLRGVSSNYREFREPDLAQGYTGFRVICLPST